MLSVEMITHLQESVVSSIFCKHPYFGCQCVRTWNLKVSTKSRYISTINNKMLYLFRTDIATGNILEVNPVYTRSVKVIIMQDYFSSSPPYRNVFVQLCYQVTLHMLGNRYISKPLSH